MTGNEARRIFIEYFQKHNHQTVRSASLVPRDDPTLLFVNAGMVQFKRVFTGDEKRDYDQAVTSQKCVRAGGKHNDLENVGYTARHHTFFEMLGNFSFGSYFKEEAIVFAWDLLTKGYGFDRKKLWVSIYLDDDEAYDIWRDRVGVSEDRIVRLGEEDNFWSMGDTGPCGPCSEIHIDRGEAFGCGRPECAVGCDCDRFLELWNLVFMQYDRDNNGNITPLPKPCIDTGLGLERVVSVLQDVPTNYETDLFHPIMETVAVLSGREIKESREVEVAMKVIADHSRAAAFLICDGVLPSNEGRGYVLRRIMRRAIRYGRNIGLIDPFLHVTVEKVFDIMAQGYPELKESAAFILNVVKNEEQKFSETLDIGLKLLTETLDDIKHQGKSEIPGDIIFKLYDTYGFPVDIVTDVVKDSDISLDMAGYEQAMQAQKNRSKRSKTFSGVGDAYKGLTAEGVQTAFVGYDTLTAQSQILLLVKDDKETASARVGDAVEIVTEKTCFYAESGGQAGDIGVISGDNFKIRVDNTVSNPTGLKIHQGEVISGRVKKGDTADLTVDEKARAATAKNHTATHILQAALQKVLGDHVKQSGSLVSKDRLRFDFTHFSALDHDQIQAVEHEVNLHIMENCPVNTFEMDMDEAVKSGATALFEEKYGDRVRVVSMAGFSKELCGGTHTSHSGNIGLFLIVSEGGIASGIRRIEAVTGESALAFLHEHMAALEEISSIVKGSKKNAPEKVAGLVSEKKAMEKEIASLKSKLALTAVNKIDEYVREINGVKFLSRRVDIENPSQLRDLADKFKNTIGSGVVLLGAQSNSKALLISVVTDDLTHRYKAGDIVKKAAAIVGGGGGGRPDMAQAGGSQPEHLDKALASVFEV
ncbi:MAG: alanine--tRNA ligase [Desulfobacteraceae bacterium]